MINDMDNIEWNKNDVLFYRLTVLTIFVAGLVVCFDREGWGWGIVFSLYVFSIVFLFFSHRS